ncbi:ankyrin-1-like [Leptopilina heterotoma]|uniref:ankyrin-1-like n=1 Tax=Leptopilina heterotoma TaxID=63436 RepID=UPI001CA9CCAE|nr:ankyrin-1-like [Leptopilina heterotoma]XP_043472525.1 ankyrin-1-like [Leptopilina heterotoma]
MSSIEIQSLQNACFSGDESAVRNILSQNNFNDYLASSSGYSLLCSMLENSFYLPQRRNELQVDYEVYELLSMLKNSMYSSQRRDELEAEDAMHKQHLAKFLEISKLLLQHPVKVNDEIEDHDQTPLHFAAHIGSVEIIKILLEKGAIVNATNKELNTPLHIAVSKINNLTESIIQLLLENGADLKIFNKYNRTPHDMTYNTRIKRILSQHEIKMLLDSGGDMEERDLAGFTALHRAVESEDYHLVEFLISKGSDVNAKTEFDETPLHLACPIHHKEISLLLLRAGANVNATTREDNTPLHLAAKHSCNDDDGDFLKMLLSNGANLKAENIYGLIPLNYAVENKSFRETTILLGEKPNICDFPLKLAFCLSFLGFFSYTVPNLEIFICGRDKQEYQLITELFYNLGFRINIEDIENLSIPEELTTLDHSTLIEHRNIVQSLLNKEETSCDDKMRQEFLEYHVLIGAIKYGFTDIFYNFLPNDCNINTCLIDGSTLLHHACVNECSTIVNELLARGANVNVNGGKNKLSPLHVSVKYNFLEITRILLTKNANINSCNSENETPLWIAVYMDSFECVQLLLEAGANVNCITSNNHTPLHCASALNRNINITKLLLHYGATFCSEETEPIFESSRYPSKSDEIIHLTSDHSVNLKVLDHNYPKCPNELEEMKNTKISETDVTMYDLLTMSHRRLSILIRNENFLDFINSFDFKTSFPNFARRFKVRVNKAKLEKRLIELSYDCFRTIVKFQLPILVLNEIISYIDTADLHRFVIASPIKSETKKTVQFHCSE